MKRVILALASITSALTISITNAGTMGPIEELPSWTGFYLGANAGYGWAHRSAHLLIPPDPGSLAFYLPALAGAMSTTIGYIPNGFIGGGQLGYHYQVDQAVLGLEADFDGANIEGSRRGRHANLGTGFAPWTGSVRGKLEWLGTVRGRVGFTPIPQALLYATAGFAYGRVKHNYSNIFALSNDIFTSSYSKTKTGYAVGGGAEWLFGGNCNWSARAEYLYYDINHSTEITRPGGRDLFFVAAGIIRPPANRFKDSGNIVRLAINYHFS